MLFSSVGLQGYKLDASDGEIGHIHDFLFDAANWHVRYLVADTGWIFGRRVLLVPKALGAPDAEERHIAVRLSKDAIRNSPDIDSDKPFSRQQEQALYGHYGLVPYWGPVGVPALGGTYPDPPGTPPADPAGQAPGAEGDPQLRSMREVNGYGIQATDDRIGSVDDFLIDAAAWQVRYLIVDTGNWLPGKKVLIAPHWARRIDWASRSVLVGVARDRIRDAPEFEPGRPIDRDYESRLYGYYGFAPYW